jgi:N6-L-threonylcarbamoyladenine synthase
MILAIETSCDDTCAAVLSLEGEVRSNVVASQLVRGVRRVVPELASPEHLRLGPTTIGWPSSGRGPVCGVEGTP